MVFLLALFLVISLLAKRLAGKSVSDMTYIVSSGTLNLNQSTPQILHSAKDYQVLLWVVLKFAPQNGWPPSWKRDKLLYVSNSLVGFDEILHDVTYCLEPYVCSEIQIFKNLR